MLKKLRIRHSDLRSASELFKDFLYKPSELSRWLGPSFHDKDSFRSTLTRLLDVDYRRKELVRILRRQNERYGASESTLRNIASIADGNALCAITGQQMVMLGGPLMILFKALTVIKLSLKLTEQLSHPVVPVFWLATDDHDFAEVSHVYLPKDDGSLDKVSYKPGVPPDGKPMADVTLDENVTQFLDSVSERLTKTEFSQALIDDLSSIYRSGESISTAFAWLLNQHLGEYGLVFIDPSDSEIRELSKAIFAKEVSDHESTHNAIAAANESLLGAGYHLQVERDDKYLSLFHVSERRTRIGFRDGEYFIEDVEDSLSEESLLGLIDGHPDRFSPNVHLRPIVQSRILPVVAFVGGPAEVAYSAQIGQLYDAFDVVPPVVCPRLSATVVESRWARFVDNNNIDIASLQSHTDREEQLTTLLREKFPEGLERVVNDSHTRILDDLDQIRSNLGDDKGLLQTYEQTRKKIDYELNSFENRVFKAHRKANDDFSQRFRSLAEHLFPEQSLQERYCSLVYFTNKYGPGFVNAAYDSLAIDIYDHQFILM